MPEATVQSHNLDLVKLLAILDLAPYGCRLVSAQLTEAGDTRLTIDLDLSPEHTFAVTEGGKQTHSSLYASWNPDTKRVQLWAIAYCEEHKPEPGAELVEKFKAASNILNSWNWGALTKTTAWYDHDIQSVTVTVCWSAFLPRSFLESSEGQRALAHTIAVINEEGMRASSACHFVAEGEPFNHGELLPPHPI